MIGSYASPLAEAAKDLLPVTPAFSPTPWPAGPAIITRPLPPSFPPPISPSPLPQPHQDLSPGSKPNPSDPKLNPDEEWPEASERYEDEEGDLVEYRRRRKRRKKHCCEPQLFPEWAVEQFNIVTDRKMGLFKDNVFVPFDERGDNAKGYTYQYCMYGTTSEFECKGGGEEVMADMSFPDRCWIGDAKHTSGTKFYSSSLPFVVDPTSDLFRRYGVVTRDPDPPGDKCWNIGLQVLTGGKGAIVEYYRKLLEKYDIEGQVLYRPIRDTCKQTGTDGTPFEDPPAKDWWEQDHFDPNSPYVA